MKSNRKLLALPAAVFFVSAIVGLLNLCPDVIGAQTVARDISLSDIVTAEFRGCESARMCRFRIESSELTYAVRPNGVLVEKDTDAKAVAVRNRLNSLMSNMIHQHKRIALLDLRKLDDGTYVATITVNGMDVSEDPILNDLMETPKK
jgi:hypothetical protein